MSKKGFIQPQRHDGKSWNGCGPQQATGWYALPLRGAPARFSTKRAAQEHLQRAARLAAPQRSFSFGARCPSRLRSAQLLATSSTHKPSSYS